MRARPGDRIILAAGRVDVPVRAGRITEVRGADDGPPFAVAWDDGHTGLFYPGPGAVLHILPSEGEAAEQQPAPSAGSGHSRQWQVHVSLSGDGRDTSATAVLRADVAELSATGESHRSQQDAEVRRIGDEVAVARALRHLADKLMAAAETDVAAQTGEDAHIRRS